jgi:hypothetical protein
VQSVVLTTITLYCQVTNGLEIYLRLPSVSALAGLGVTFTFTEVEPYFIYIMLLSDKFHTFQKGIFPCQPHGFM